MLLGCVRTRRLRLRGGKLAVVASRTYDSHVDGDGDSDDDDDHHCASFSRVPASATWTRRVWAKLIYFYLFFARII
jgi:hypothetical protein